MFILDMSIIGLIIALISQKFRQLIFYAVSRILFLFIRRTYLHQSLGNTLIAYLSKSGFKNKKFTGELYGEDIAFIRSENEARHILYRDLHSNTQLFYGNGWPVLISGTPLTQHKDSVHRYSYVVYSFRWSSNLLSFLENATESKNDKVEDVDVNRFVVKRVSGGKFYREGKEKESGNEGITVSEYELADPFSALIPIKWEKSNIGQLISRTNTIDMMSLNPELEDLLEEIRFWYSAQEWYEERGIVWRRGLLFYGKPGTGKTLYSRLLAEELNMPIIIFDLSSMNNEEFIYAWSQILPKRIVLFEDFDAVFHKRQNIINGELTFDAILNCLDGADKKQGVLTIITTNHPETLDFALGGPNEGEELKGQMPSRPGRIDRAVEFLPLDRKGRVKLVMRIVQDEKIADKLVDEGKDDSAAQLQERAFRVAIDMFFNKRKQAKEVTAKQLVT